MRRGSAFVVLGLLTLALPACSSGSSEAGRWDPIPPSPLSAREHATSVWTGDEVLVLGGDDTTPYCPPWASCLGSDEPALADGAAFDPATSTWRSIADAPAPVFWPSAAVANGQVYIWTSDFDRRGDRATFLHYDPDADRWDEPPPPPLDDDEAVSLTGSDAGLVAYVRYGDRTDWSTWRFDAASETWAELPADPLQPSGYREMVWIGEELVVVDAPPTQDPDAGPQFYRAATFDPERSEWHRLPAQQAIAAGTSAWFSVDATVVNPVLGSIENHEWPEQWERTYPGGGRLFVESQTWDTLPDAPELGQGGNRPSLPLVAGDRFITADRWIFDNFLGVWLDPGAPDGFPDEGMTAMWTGDEQLFVWGGADVDDDESDHELLADGWLWTGPPLNIDD